MAQLRFDNHLPITDKRGPESSIRSDFTLFMEREEFLGTAAKVLGKQKRNSIVPPSLDEQIAVCFGTKKMQPDDQPLSGRIHAVPCFGGEFYSVTLRSLKWPDVVVGAPDSIAELRERCDVEWESENLPHLIQSEKAIKGANALPEDILGWNPKICFEPAPVLSQLLYKLCFPEPGRAHGGLILFTGGTGTGKTTYLNGVLRRYLPLLLGGKRKPHVVAIGDPVETFLCAPNKEGPDEIARSQIAFPMTREFDFTMRILNKDVESVDRATKDALRETPSAFIISELREDQDFRAALRFAATGHLILATSHSTTLADALERLLSVSNARTAAGRATVAQRVLGVVHHSVISGPDKESWRHYFPANLPTFRETAANIPAVWLGNSEGRRNLVSDGLSSLVAKAPGSRDVSSGSRAGGALGRYWMACRLEEAGDAYAQTATPKSKKTLEYEALRPLYTYFKKQALALDLQNR
jgi:hypothetical protein